MELMPINKKYKRFGVGGSMEKVDLSKTHGTKRIWNRMRCNQR